jgi:hypothetical protein
MANVAWVVDFLAKMSMRATAVHANYHATHAQNNSPANVALDLVNLDAPERESLLLGALVLCVCCVLNGFGTRRFRSWELRFRVNLENKPLKNKNNDVSVRNN